MAEVELHTYKEIREFVQELCVQGLSAIDTNDRLHEKFGVQSPTLNTVYKWRREVRGGKGEREMADGQTAVVESGPRPAKTAKKECDKFCSSCNREMSSRPYYELHMLKSHNVFLGDSKPVLDFLVEMPLILRQQLIFRCDACFGGELDYDSLEELYNHKQLEHGQQMRKPNWDTGNESDVVVKKEKKVQAVSPPPKKVRRAKHVLRKSSYLGIPPVLRRSTRVPKPTSMILESLITNKELAKLAKEQLIVKQELGSTGTTPGPAQSLQQALSLAVREEDIRMLEKGTTGRPEAAQQGPQEMGEGVEGTEKQNNPANHQKQKPLLTILKDGGLEVEEQEKEGIGGEAELGQRQQPLLSPAALEAANSMLKLAFASGRGAAISAENVNSLPPSICHQNGDSNLPSSSQSLARAQDKQQDGDQTLLAPKQALKNTNGPKKKHFAGSLDNSTKLLKNKRTSKKTTGKAKVGRKPRALAPVEGGQQQQKAAHQHLSQNGLGNDIKNAAPNPDKKPQSQNNDNNANETFASLFSTQDEFTWFGHSIAAQLRKLADPGLRELAKMRIQQVIFECNRTNLTGLTQQSPLAEMSFSGEIKPIIRDR